MLKCKVCGCEFVPIIDRHYITRDNGESGLTAAFKSTEGKLYDTFDCPACGCQITAQERKRRFTSILTSEYEVNDKSKEIKEKNHEKNNKG